jgi:hypothetical protein
MRIGVEFGREGEKKGLELKWKFHGVYWKFEREKLCWLCWCCSPNLLERSGGMNKEEDCMAIFRNGCSKNQTKKLLAAV